MGLLDLFKKLFATKKRVRQKNGREKLIKSNPKPEEVHSNITRDVGETIPAEKRIQGIKPTPEGLYPHEILLLHYAPSYYIDEESFQGFWWYKYGVRDVKQSLSSLLDRGYLEVGSLQSAIEKETVATLKDILRENNLKVSGKKAELVQRLLDEVPDGQLKNYFTKYTYQLTDVGKFELEQNEHILYIHRKPIDDLDIFTLTKKIQESPKVSFRDIIWGHFNESSQRYIKDNNYGLYRNTRLSMSEFIEEEGKDDASFALLAEVIRYDLSGLSNGFNPDYLAISSNSFFPYSTSMVKMAPGIIRKVVDFKKKNDLSDEELKNKLADSMEKIRLPFSVFTVDENIEIVLMEINDETAGLEKLYDQVQIRFENEYLF